MVYPIVYRLGISLVISCVAAATYLIYQKNHEEQIYETPYQNSSSSDQWEDDHLNEREGSTEKEGNALRKRNGKNGLGGKDEIKNQKRKNDYIKRKEALEQEDIELKEMEGKAISQLEELEILKKEKEIKERKERLEAMLIDIQKQKEALEEYNRN